MVEVVDQIRRQKKLSGGMPVVVRIYRASEGETRKAESSSKL